MNRAVVNKWNLAEYFNEQEASKVYEVLDDFILHLYKDDNTVQEAMFKYADGVQPFISTGICGDLTAGYGRLDDNGYWEFPLPSDFVAKFISKN